MHLPRLLRGSWLLVATSLLLTTSLASAAHLPGVLPLSGSPDHSHEKFSTTSFPSGNYSTFSFAFADLSNCSFAPGSNLSFADFTGATLTNTNFTGCNLNFAKFSGADLSNARLPCMGGADLRGAILTGAIGGGIACAGCVSIGHNLYDVCTVNSAIGLCLAFVQIRAIVSGMVFLDTNANGQLDFGEPGVPGASVSVSAGGAPVNVTTDSRGGYSVPSFTPLPGSVQVTPPAGSVLTGSGTQMFNLAYCRSGQGLDFPVLAPVTPARRATFGRVKALYR